MLWKSKRMDDLDIFDGDPTFYTDDEYDESVRKTRDFGWVFGGYTSTLKAFDALPQRPRSILDVGCGSGIFTTILAEYFRGAEVVGVDIAHEAIIAARTHHISYEKMIGEELPNLSFQTRQSHTLIESEKSFDVVTATFLCHHLKNDNVVEFLRVSRATARTAVIINDLHRSMLAYTAFWCISPFLYNRMIRRGGLRAIRKSFARSDWERCLLAAGIDLALCTISWRWAFGWVVTIACV